MEHQAVCTHGQSQFPGLQGIFMGMQTSFCNDGQNTGMRSRSIGSGCSFGSQAGGFQQQAAVRSAAQTAKWTADKTIVKVIVVPGRIINIVVK